MSFPTRERGLKYFWYVKIKYAGTVVPHAGTWIEIKISVLEDNN